jgi:hypothetical protein
MQQPPNPYPQYPQQQWQQPSQPLPPPQQRQQQPDYTQQQQWHQPDYTQPPTYNPPQLLPIQRPKRNRVVWWVSGGITCVVLVVLVVVGYVLIGQSFFPSPSHSVETNFTSTQYPTLHAEYSGTITDPPVTSNVSATTSPMGLIITSNNQGHISGRVGILLAPNGGDPFIGTLGVDGTITFTATPLFIGSLTIFTGKVNSDGSISGTTSNIFQPASWTLFPVKGQ